MYSEMEPQLKKNHQSQGASNKAKITTSAKRTFPKSNAATLPMVEAKPMSSSELRNYLKKLNSSLKLNNTEKENIEKNMNQFSSDAGLLEMAALSAWYNGGVNEAISLGVNACLKKPSDTLMLNNLGALLNLDSKEISALPLLKTLAAKVEGNSMIYNNLGQCYAGLGYLDSAMYYFGACTKLSPNHPEANNTAGQIEEERGNTKEAIEHFKNSLKGAYNDGAANSLGSLAPDFQFVSVLHPPVKLPYFNDDKYHLPPYCTNTKEAKIVKQKEEDFDNLIDPLIQQYEALAKEEGKLSAIETLEISKKLISNPGVLDLSYLFGPFSNINKIYLVLNMETTNRLISYKNDFESKELAIKELLKDLKNKENEGLDAYEKEIQSLPCDARGTSGCAAIAALEKARCEMNNGLADACLTAVAGIKKDMEEKQLMIAREMFEDRAYYLCLSMMTNHQAKAAFYEAAKDFLSALTVIKRNRLYIYPGDCVHLSDASPDPQSDSITHYKCPINIEFKFIVGKIKLTCEKFQFSMGEVGRFKYEKNFNTKQSTIAMGIGAGIDMPGFDLITGGGKAEEMYYISFDANNNINDFGISFEMKGYLKSDLDVLKVSVEKGAGYTVGINSGWTFKAK
ncbi:MAG: hypothetical protein NVSMB67_19640 [Flavisolibacter sp.]